MRLLDRNTVEIEMRFAASVAIAVKRRYRSKEERRRIVEESIVPGASVAVVARAKRHLRGAATAVPAIPTLESVLIRMNPNPQAFMHRRNFSGFLRH